MLHVSIDEAQERLTDLIEAVLNGETVAIRTADQRCVQLVPMARPRPPRQFGSAKGLFVLSEDFDAPLPDFGEYTR